MCIGCPSNTSIFGNTSQFIKLQGSDFVAIEGVNTVERLIGSDIRIPYKQLLKSRIILKAGQSNYLMNHLGLGDNATFVAMKATYNQKSVNEEDNYVDYYYYNNLSTRLSFNQLLVLSGNSSNRIEQIYLTNPNANYAVTLDVMVAVIDDTYSFFNDTLNQNATSFTNLAYTDIDTYVINQSITIKDVNNNPLIYLNLANINSITRSDKIITIEDDTLGDILLLFKTLYDAYQAYSLISYVLSNSDVNISTLDPLADSVAPKIFFYSNIGNTSSGYTISSTLTSSVPTYAGATFGEFGRTFSTQLTLSSYGAEITKSKLIELLISGVNDNRDGTMSITVSNILLTGTNSNTVTSITGTGTHSMSFDFSDIAQNYVNGVMFYLNIV